MKTSRSFLDYVWPILVILSFALIYKWQFDVDWLLDHRPTDPDFARGLKVSVAQHGSDLYLSKAEYLQYWATFAGAVISMACGISAAWVAELRRRKRARGL